MQCQLDLLQCMANYIVVFISGCHDSKISTKTQNEPTHSRLFSLTIKTQTLIVPGYAFSINTLAVWSYRKRS